VCVSVTGHISKEDGKLLCVCWSVSASTFVCVCVSVTGHISKEDGKLLCVCWSVSASTFELPDL